MIRFTALLFCLLVFMAAPAAAQLTFSVSPGRTLGHARQTAGAETASPNLVEGRELYSPRGVALDTTVSPPRVYVADSANNRVLGWRDAAQFDNAAPADVVIGQRSPFATVPGGPGTSFPSGLNFPTGLAVDGQGHLFVVDTNNNRVVRYRAPFDQAGTPDNPVTADLVLGQAGLQSGNAANRGQRTPAAETLSLSVDLPVWGAPHASLTFDAGGNLWLTDSGNHRVLRYSASVVQANTHGPAADLVVGQDSMLAAVAATGSGARTNRTRFNRPASLLVDSTGRVLVGDSLARVLVFDSPQANGGTAARILGLYVPATGAGAVRLPNVNEYSLGASAAGSNTVGPLGLFAAGEYLYAVDTVAHRIVQFPSRFPAETTAEPSPKAVEAYGTNGATAVERLRSAEVKQNRGQAVSWDNGFSGPFAAAAGGGFVFVADTFNHRVLRFRLAGDNLTPAADAVLGQFGFDLNAPNLLDGREFFFFGNPAGAGVALDLRADPPLLYVADTNNNRVLGFRDARRLRAGARADLVIGQPDFLRSVPNFPSGEANRPTAASLVQPVGVAVDGNGDLYVADSGNGRVLRFPRPFELPEGAPREANLVLGQAQFDGGRVVDPTGATMRRPTGLALTGDGNLLVADSLFNRVLFFRRDGGDFTNGQSATAVFGQPDYTSSASGTGLASLNAPHHIAVDLDSRLYVADTGNNRVVVYRSVNEEGELGREAIASITDAQLLRSPQGIAIDARNGELYVASAGTSRILRYRAFDFDFPARSTVLVRAANGQTADFVPSQAPLAMAVDASGNLFVADGLNRVTLHFPAAFATHAANGFTRPLAPGMLATLTSLAGTSFTDGEQRLDKGQAAMQLADVEVYVDGRPAPLTNVSRNSITFVLPMETPTRGFVDVEVIQPSTGAVRGFTQVAVAGANPGLFTVSGDGKGQLVAINVEDGGTNGAGNGARRGELVRIFGTGQGFINGAPPDGTAPSDLVPTEGVPTVVVGTARAEVVSSGLAPGEVGTWAITVRVPANTLPGDTVDVVVDWRDLLTNREVRGSAQVTHRTTIVVR